VLVKRDSTVTLVVRGSPDDVLPLCAGLTRRAEIDKFLEERGLAGERVIAVAVKTGLKESSEPADEEHDLEFVGLIAFVDPLKPGAVAAARKAKALGVQIKILTGDSREVAGAVGRKLGLIDDPRSVITGADFDSLDDAGRHRAAKEFRVFARMNPAQKFAVLSLLQEADTVGFLGEGFNDAPGLKLANVALAVEGASDIAKEAADVILLNRSLGVIFDGIEEGRRTFVNIVKYLKITMASNFGNFYSVAIASLFIDFLPMLPVQILLLNLLSDFPMITIAADSVDIKELKKPKRYDPKDIALTATVLGIVSSVFDFTTFAIFHGYGEHTLQTVWFIESTLTEIALIYSLRTSGKFWRGARVPKSILFFTGSAVAAVFLVPLTGLGRSLFNFAAPAAWQALVVFGIVGVYFVCTELVKLWYYGGKNGNGKRHATSA
jgi:Mg2+-importing ATPase